MGRFKQYVLEQEEKFWDQFWYYMDDDPNLKFDDVIKKMQPYEKYLIGGTLTDRMWEMKQAFNDHVKGEQP